jgi:hypothetical protein
MVEPFESFYLIAAGAKSEIREAPRCDRSRAGG